MYITLCERKGSFLPRFRKLSSETIQTDSNGFKPRAARRTTKTRKERREKRRKTTLSTKISLAFFLSSSSVLLSKKNHLFLKENKKKKRRRKPIFNGRNQLSERTIFYIYIWVFSHQTGLFCTNRNALYTNKKHYHEVFTNASIIINE